MVSCHHSPHPLACVFVCDLCRQLLYPETVGNSRKAKLSLKHKRESKLITSLFGTEENFCQPSPHMQTQKIPASNGPRLAPWSPPGRSGPGETAHGSHSERVRLISLPSFPPLPNLRMSFLHFLRFVPCPTPCLGPPALPRGTGSGVRRRRSFEGGGIGAEHRGGPK